MSNYIKDLLIEFLPAVVLIIYMIYVQVAERSFKPKKYIIWPIILVWVTFSTLEKIKGGIAQASLGILLLVIIGIICGVIAGFITKIYKKEDGNTYIKGGWQMLVFLIISLPIRFILSHLITSWPQDVALNYGTAYLVRLTFQFIARGIVVYLRVPEFWQIYSEQRKARRQRRVRRSE